MGKTKNAQSEGRKRLRESGSQTDEDSLQEEDSSAHCCEDKFAEVNTKLDKILHSLAELEALKDKVSSLEKESKDLKDNAEFAHKEITDLKATVIYACSNVERLENELTSLQEELDYWKRRSIRLESYSRRENIKIFNVQETDENTEAVVKKFLNENLKIPQNDVDVIRFERVHRLPTRQSNKPRPMIVRFSFFQDKEFV